MCILFFALNRHPKYPLIVAANRDEYHRRPSQSMHEWPDHPGIIAGRDLEAGGTWLGINRQGRFAAITNYRDGRSNNQGKRSRGELVRDFLSSAAAEQSRFEDHLKQHHARYNPFNLVYGDIEGIRAWDHRSSAVRTLAPGFHSVSNGPIDELWPKMSIGVKKIAECISRCDDLTADIILPMMLDCSKPGESELPQTGVGSALEKQLSSIFIRGEDYGTRTTTILLFANDRIEVTEQDYMPNGEFSSSQNILIRPEKI